MAKKNHSVLMVLTSHDRIDDQHATGVWFEEFAVPYRLFRAQGYRVTVASTRGGRVPVDPRSAPDHPDTAAREALLALERSTALAAVKEADFDAVFFPGGHGTMYDLPENPEVTHLVERFAIEDKVIAAVCHGPAALVGPTRRDGRPLVEGRHIAAFTNAEERAVELEQRMPFLLETRLKDLGAQVDVAPPWSDQVVVDGHLITGQNPQSSGSAARKVIELLA
jgi:putative intracellular protease/amidase